MHPCWTQAAKDFRYLEQVTSIDCWAELLDEPKNTTIVRAKGNWLARLAVTVVAFQKSKKVLIASKEVCWERVKKIRSQNTSFAESSILIVC